MADYTPRMRAKYDEQIVKAMTEKFGYKNRIRCGRSHPGQLTFRRAQDKFRR